MNKKIAEFMKCEAEAREPLAASACDGLVRLALDAAVCQGRSELDLEKHPAIDMREYIYQHADSYGGCGLDYLPRGRRNDQRGLRECAAVHHGTEPRM